MNPSDLIRERIRTSGPISFAEFMDLALYGPGGFYEDPPVGERGHFVTSPHVHPVFGLLLARAVTIMWDAMDEPGPPMIVEIGAGDGTLASQLLTEIPDAGYVAVERSEGSRRRLASAGIRAASDISELEPRQTTVVVANELLDNLAFHRVRMSGAGIMELLVDLEGDRFVEREAGCPPGLAEASPRLEAGEEAAVCLAVTSFIGHLAPVIGRGYVLLIDYGRTPREPGGGVRGYRDQNIIEDLLSDPGTADITAGVNFEAVTRAAVAEGMQVFTHATQGQALLALGFERWTNEQRDLQIRRLNEGAGREAVRTWSGRNAAQLLVDPRELGSLTWMTVATHGLPAPPWVTATTEGSRG